MTGPNRLIALAALFFAASVVIILTENRSWHGYETVEMKEFQRSVCGFGLGATISPAWGFMSYDPRIDGVDETQLWPLPGWYSYSPDRGLSVSDFQETRVLP